MAIADDILLSLGEDAEEVVNTFYRVKGNKINPSMEDLEYLMKQYNKYIDKYPNNLRCGDCRRIIFKSWEYYITEWETIEK